LILEDSLSRRSDGLNDFQAVAVRTTRARLKEKALNLSPGSALTLLISSSKL
jgi:hypothetical protein